MKKYTPKELQLGFIESAPERRKLEKNEQAIRRHMNKFRPSSEKLVTSRKKLRRLPKEEIIYLKIMRAQEQYGE